MPVWWIGKGKVLQEKKTSHGERGGMVIITGKETGTEKNWIARTRGCVAMTLIRIRRLKSVFKITPQKKG